MAELPTFEETTSLPVFEEAALPDFSTATGLSGNEEPNAELLTFSEAINAPTESLARQIFTPPTAPLQGRQEANPIDVHESIVGISPEGIPSGFDVEPKNAPEAVLFNALGGKIGLGVLSAGLKTAAGIGQYLTSPQGLTEIGLGATPAAPAIVAKWFLDMVGGAVSAPGKALEAYKAGDYQGAIDESVAGVASLAGAGLIGRGALKGKAAPAEAPPVISTFAPLTAKALESVTKEVSTEIRPADNKVSTETPGLQREGSAENISAEGGKVENAAGRLEQLKAIKEPTAEQIAERDALQARTDSVWGDLKPKTPPKASEKQVEADAVKAAKNTLNHLLPEGSGLGTVLENGDYQTPRMSGDNLKEFITKAKSDGWNVGQRVNFPDGTGQAVLRKSKATTTKEASIADILQTISDIEKDFQVPTSTDYTTQLVLERGKLAKLQRQYDASQMPTQSLIKSIKNQKDVLEQIQQRVSQRDSVTENRAKAVAVALLKKYPSYFTAKNEYPYVVGNEKYSELSGTAKSKKTNAGLPDSATGTTPSTIPPKPTKPSAKASETQGAEPPAETPIATAPKARLEGEPPKPVESATTTYPTDGTNVKMRKSAARASESEAIPEQVRETIKTASESFYTQQSTAEVKKLIASMPDSELANVPRDSNLYVASKLEQAKRLFNEGKDDAGYNVFVELEKEGTRLGQLVNQFKLLEGTTPASVVKVIDAGLKKGGRDPLTPEQRIKVEGIATESIKRSGELDRAKNEWVKNPTPENAAAADTALQSANKADVELQSFVHRFQPKSIPQTLKSIIQGNLLTPISEVANVVGNMSFLPFRAMDRGIAAGLDVIDAYIRGRPREITVQPVAATAEAAKSAAAGLSKAPAIIAKGSGNVIKGESYAGMHPLRAWQLQFAKSPDAPTIGGKLPFAERARLVLEGTFGIPAEVMLRGLAVGDVPFREGARGRIVANEAKLAKIPRAQWAMAKKFPDLFFDQKTLARIEGETQAAVFQRQSKSLNYLTRMISRFGPWAEFAVSTIAPYKLTPWNIVSEILSYNPLVAATRTAYDAKVGNSRSAKLNAGKFVVGTMLTTAGYWLYKNGLVAPSMDTPDERTKARLLAGQIMPPNHLNVSGLTRKLAGGDPAFQAGDRTADLFRAGGLAGSVFYMTANIGRDMEKQPDAQNAMFISLVRNSTLEQARFGMNQSFLQGVGGLLEAIKSGNTDNYVHSWMNTVLSIPLPNTLTTLSRAQRPFKIETEGFEDLLRARLGFSGLDDYLPLKRGLWGEPIPETPKDRSALLYHFFDITKAQQTTSDPVAIELYKLWRKTGDTSVIPTPPGKTVTYGGETYKLNPVQRSRLAELVGAYRREIAQSIITDPEWQKQDDETKSQLLDVIYRKGLEAGKGEFISEFDKKLEPKAKRAGFNQQN